jgi:hypothetical protein
MDRRTKSWADYLAWLRNETDEVVNPKMDRKRYLTVKWTSQEGAVTTRGHDDTRHGKIRATWLCDWLDGEGLQYETNFGRKPIEVTA